MSSEPPRRPPYQPPTGGGGGGFYRHPVKPTKKRPRETVADREGTEADAFAAAAAANAPPPPNLRQLRRHNARRWEEVVRLRERLAQREAERRRRDGDLPAPAQAAAATAVAHGPGGDVDGNDQQQQQQQPGQVVGNNRDIDRLHPLDRRLAAHRAELALLVQQQEPQGQAAAGEQQLQQQQNEQNERNVRAIQAHRSMIQNARLHQAQLFGNEIIETYDGLAQLHAHLDRTIGVAPRDNNNNAGAAAAADAEDNEAAAATNADNDEGVDDGITAQDRAVLTLHDRIAEAEARVEEHRVIHTALMDMLQRRRSDNDDAQETIQDNNDGAAVVTDAAAAGRIGTVGQPIRSNTDAAAEEAQRIHAEMVYFAQRFDAHLDRMEQVAATAAREEREGDTLSDDEDNADNEAEGGENGAAGRAGTGNNNNNQARPSPSTSSSSSQNPFLATMFVELARRMVSNREDPYVSIEAVIGAAAGASSSSSSRQRRIERRRRIVDHFLASGVLVRHTDNADLICFNYFD